MSVGCSGRRLEWEGRICSCSSSNRAFVLCAVTAGFITSLYCCQNALTSLVGWLMVHAIACPSQAWPTHFVSEAIYLSDPDGHGIEIYWDRPRELWEGQVAKRMTTLPLDTSSLFGELADPTNEPFDGMPAGTTMGHVHLCVADIPQTIAFYRDVLGFGLMASLGGQAAFLSAGGYHHHLGANTWESAGAGQPPGGAATLRAATIVLPSEAERDRLASRAADAGYEP